MAKTGLVIEEHGYPNALAGRYKTITLNGQRIGSYDIVDGGFLPNQTRKVLSDERDAQLNVIWRYVQYHLKLSTEAATAWKVLGGGDGNG